MLRMTPRHHAKNKNLLKIFMFASVLSITFSGSLLADDLVGRWSIDSKTSTGITIKQDLSSEIEVNVNQIYIRTRLSRSKDRFFMFLQRPLDLGRGGLLLDWQKKKKNIPIAELRPDEEGSLNFSWKGFYDIRKKAFTWIEEADFFRDNPATFYHCNDY